MNSDNNWKTSHDNQPLLPRNAIGIRHILFLSVVLAIPIGSRDYDSFYERMTFVSIAVALSVVFAVATNLRRKVSMPRVIASMSLGVALYATSSSLLVDIITEHDSWMLFGELRILYSGLLGLTAMCAIMLVIFALG